MPKMKYTGIRRRGKSLLLQEARKLGMAERVAILVAQQKTYEEISSELGISLEQVRAIVASPEYEQAIDALIADVARDPRRRLAVQYITDLIPAANRILKKALEDDDVPWSVRRWAVELVYRISHVGASVEISEEETLRDFLQKSRNVNINVVSGDQVVISGALDPEYVRALESIQGNYELLDSEASDSSVSGCEANGTDS
ncbi:MAG: hypothetical protein QXZ09_07000 [Candidatus Methanomethylicaceae archaeon]